MLGKPSELPQAILEKIQRLCQKQMSAMAMQDDFGLYIPPSASLMHNYNSTFDLTGAVNDFIEGNRTVLLLLGESGSGKSFFGQALIKRKSEVFQPGDSIPLFISLPSLRNPKTRLMQEVLELNGFSQEEIEYLRSTQKFLLVFDAYDEINIDYNLCKTNDMEVWNAQIVITCRLSYLSQDRNYKYLFMPYKMKKPYEPSYQELYVAPFVRGQIDQYIKQFLIVRSEELRKEILLNDALSEEWLKPKTYLQWIERIHGLKDLSRQPFLLRITMEVLPQIVVEYQTVQNTEKQYEMTQAKLYDNFVHQWFTRQENKLLSSGESVGRTFQKDCMAFAKMLGIKMFKQNLQVVCYEENSELDEDAENPNEEWAYFFSDRMIPQDKNSESRRESRIRARKACLLKQVDKYQMAFIHATLRDYFYTLNLAGPEKKPQVVPVNPSPKAVLPAPISKHRVVGRFCLMNRLDRTEAAELLREEGIKVVFDSKDERQKFVLGQGSFGKFRIARNLINNRFSGVKKIRGEEPIRNSKNEAEFQRELTGLSNVMPLWESETIKSKKTGEDILLQFMPPAGFGNGELLFNLLPHIKNRELKQKFLIHILKSSLIALKGMHGRRVYHLDFKPDNFVLDCRGTLYVIDFGCANRDYSNKNNALLTGGKGHIHYLSPDRLAHYRKIAFKKIGKSGQYEFAENYDGEKVDIWALGISILELYLENNNFINGCNTGIEWKYENWNCEFFTRTFESIEGWKDAPENSLLGVIKLLLRNDPILRASAAQALKNPIFSDSNSQLSPEELKQIMSELMKLKDNPPQKTQVLDLGYGGDEYSVYTDQAKNYNLFYPQPTSPAAPRVSLDLSGSTNNRSAAVTKKAPQPVPEKYSTLNEDDDSDSFELEVRK